MSFVVLVHHEQLLRKRDENARKNDALLHDLFEFFFFLHFLAQKAKSSSSAPKPLAWPPVLALDTAPGEAEYAGYVLA